MQAHQQSYGRNAQFRMAEFWQDLKHQRHGNPSDCIDDSESAVVAPLLLFREGVFRGISSVPPKPQSRYDEQRDSGGDRQAH